MTDDAYRRGLLALPDDEFLARWVALTGEVPATILDTREAMVDILLADAPRDDDPPPPV